MRKQFFHWLVATVMTATQVFGASTNPSKPNIVFILADDLGYGDVHCLNPGRGKISTPNLDALAAAGMTFTDAHSTSAVCSPSRYGILTGRYNWRSTLQSGIVPVYGEKLIKDGRLTVAGLLQQQGYTTIAIGKWHLGWHWPRVGTNFDFTQPITGGPTAVGFDYSFGVDIPNYPPYCFIENGRTIGLPTVPLPEALLGHNLASIAGVSLPGWSLEAVLPTITDKACDLIAAQAKSDKPFFMYFALTSPHTPLAVAAEFRGQSGLGRYADFVMETDAMIGRVLKAIEAGGIASNTVVIFASDNGVAPYVGVDGPALAELKAKGYSVAQASKEYNANIEPIKELEAMGHYSSADRRGYKADIWDGGHRIPLLVRWPGKIKAGSTNDQLVSLVDFMATCADITGAKIPANAGEDSFSLLPLLTGQTTAPIHEAVVFHSINGSFAIQQGRWKLELCPDSGGWSNPKPRSPAAKQLPPLQLYDLNQDVGERTNEFKAQPEIVARLTKLLEKYVKDGRTTPGPLETNDVPVKIMRSASGRAKPVSNDS